MRVLDIATLAAAGVLATAAAAAGEMPARAAVTGGEGFAWVRMCGQEHQQEHDGGAAGSAICFTGSAAARSVTAAMIEPPGDAAVFRVAVPGPLQLQYGAHLSIDNDPPLAGRFFACYAGRCVTDREATPGLVARLKAGRTLRVEAVGLSGTAVSFELPLSETGNSFRTAAEAAPVGDAALFDERRKQLLAYSRTLPGVAEQGQASVYSPWEKFCGKEHNQEHNQERDHGGDARGEVCFTGRDTRAGDGRVLFAAALIEEAGDRSKLFRVNVPGPVRLDYGARLTIDHDEPLRAAFFTCYADACMADYRATPELMARLRGAGTIAVAAIDLEGRQVSFTLPLSDPPAASFASAYDGPAVDPGAFALRQKKLQEDLRKRAEAIRRDLEAGQPAKY